MLEHLLSQVGKSWPTPGTIKDSVPMDGLPREGTAAGGDSPRRGGLRDARAWEQSPSRTEVKTPKGEAAVGPAPQALLVPSSVTWAK